MSRLFRAAVRPHPFGSSSRRRPCLLDGLEPRLALSAAYLVPATNADATIFDATRNRLYVTAGSSILRYDLTTKALLTPFTGVGSSLGGGDITTDGRYLYVADQTIAAGQSLVHKVDLTTGAVKNITYAIDYDDAASQVVITSDNRALIGHSGQWGDVHVLDLATDKFITTATTNTYGASMYRGKDRSLVVVSANGISPGESTVYDARTHAWTDGGWNSGIDDVAITPDGSEIATSNAYVGRTMNLIRTRTMTTGVLGVDPNGSLLYTFEPTSGDPDSSTPAGGKVVARDRLTDASKFSFSVDADITYSPAPSLGAATDDGHWLVMIGSKGAHVYDLTPFKPAAPTASIAGTVFKDADSNGVRAASEIGLANVKMYLDANLNGVLDTGETSVLTDTSGNYKFAGLASGATYRVRQVAPAGFGVKAPAAAYVDVAMTTIAAVTGKVFADALVGSIAGTIANDANANGKRDAGELGLGLWSVYLDANNNGKLDAGELSTTTDINGNWKFASLFAGSYVVRVGAVAGAVFTSTGSVATVALGVGANVTGKFFGVRAIL